MMEFIRERARGVVAIGIILLLCLTFLLWGIESYIEAARQVVVAKVNGEDIQLTEYQKAFDRMRHRAQTEQGAEFDSDLWSRESTKEKVLDALVEDRLLKQLIEKSNLRLSDAQVAQFIATSEAFVVDGKFSKESFKQIASTMGLSPAGFEHQLRTDLAQQQLRAGISTSAFSLKTEAQELAQLLEQKRDVAYALVKPEDPKTVTVTDADLEAHYQAHREEFRTPEKAALEYLELKVEDLKPEVTVDDKALQDHYDTHKAQYTTQEERSVNHVLVQVKKDAPEAAVEAARQRAATLRAAIVGGKAIEAVARESSDDIGSKAEGGATGFFPRGVMAPEFEAAAFALKKGEMSEPVRTEFGFHVIKVKDERIGGVKPFADVSADVESAYRTEQAETKFFERAEKFTDALNEHPDSLAAAGEVAKLTLHSLPLSTREEIKDHFSAGVAAAVWEHEVLNEGLASSPVEIGSNRIVAVRVTSHETSKVPARGELTERLTDKVQQERVRDAARTRGEALLARLQKGESAKDVMAVEKLEWTEVRGVNRESSELNRAVGRAAFGSPLKDASAKAFLGVPMGNGAYAVVEVSNLDLPKPEAIEGRKVDAIARDTERVRLIATWRDFIGGLRTEASIKTFPKAL